MGRKQNSSCRDDTAMSLRAAVLLAALCLLGGAAVVARGQLTDDFYDGCCPQAEDIVKARVSAAMKTEFRMGASLLRLHFHDCFVNHGAFKYYGNAFTAPFAYCSLEPK